MNLVLSSSCAPSDIFVLLSWSSRLYATCIGNNPNFIESDPWRALIGSMTLLLDMLLSSLNAKPSLKHGGLVRTRRALRSVSKIYFLELLLI